MIPLAGIHALVGSVILIATGPVAQAPRQGEGEPNVVEEAVESGDIAIETLPDDLSALGPVSYEPDFAVRSAIAFALWREAGALLAAEAGENAGPADLDAFAATRIAAGADRTASAERLAALSQLADARSEGERARLLACLSHDTDPAVGLDLASWNGESIAVFDGCGSMDRDILTEAWDVRLAPLARFEDEPRVEFTIDHLDPDAFAEARRVIEASGAMERVAEAVVEDFVVPGRIEVVAMSCGDGPARSGAGQIVVCYELVERTRALVSAP